MKQKTWKEVLLEIIMEVGFLTSIAFLFASGIWLVLNTLK